MWVNLTYPGHILEPIQCTCRLNSSRVRGTSLCQWCLQNVKRLQPAHHLPCVWVEAASILMWTCWKATGHWEWYRAPPHQTSTGHPGNIQEMPNWQDKSCNIFKTMRNSGISKTRIPRIPGIPRIPAPNCFRTQENACTWLVIALTSDVHRKNGFQARGSESDHR